MDVAPVNMSTARERGMAKKAAAQAEKDAREKAKADAAEAAAWEVGAKDKSKAKRNGKAA